MNMSTTEPQIQEEEQIQKEEQIVTTIETEKNRMVGQVKWFNNKAGFGFITVKGADAEEKDIFAHYTTINVSDSQYRYLVQGEYVEFDLSTSSKPPHEYQSSNISGIKGGKLMCETRQVNRPAKKEYEPRTNLNTTSTSTVPRSERLDGSNTRKRVPSSNSRPNNPSYKDAVKVTDTDTEGFQVVRKRKV